MIKDWIKNIDFILVVCVIALATIGIVGIYSAGYATDVNKDEYIKQIIFFGVGMLIIIILQIIPNSLFELGGYFLYIINLILLVGVLFTSKIMGASSWFNLGGILYQPSELMKIGFVLTFAKLLVGFKKIQNSQKKNKILMIIALLAKICFPGSFILPVSLILLQPDFGTAAVFLVIALFMLFKSGIKYKYILIGGATLLVCIPLVYFFLLNDIQQARINVFLDPSLDPLGSGYNAIQSKLAVGSGMLFGTGILQGVQTQLGYIPIKTSDFIYSVLSEEFGFIMSVLIIILFAIMIIRIIRTSKYASDEYFGLVVIGIAGMIFFHFVQNIGMTIGILPITGVPLPFVSYGGSSMITNSIAIGIVLNVAAKKNKNILF